MTITGTVEKIEIKKTERCDYKVVTLLQPNGNFAFIQFSKKNMSLLDNVKEGCDVKATCLIKGSISRMSNAKHNNIHVREIEILSYD